MVAGETVYAALFSRLQSKVALCKTFGRKWVEAEEVPLEQQPMLICTEGDELPQVDPAAPSSWLLEAVVTVYARTNDTPTPGTVLSAILDQIKAALEPQPTDGYLGIRAHTNLGLPAVIDGAWIAGQVMKEDGSLSNGQGWMSIPINILVMPT